MRIIFSPFHTQTSSQKWENCQEKNVVRDNRKYEIHEFEVRFDTVSYGNLAGLSIQLRNKQNPELSRCKVTSFHCIYWIGKKCTTCVLFFFRSGRSFQSISGVPFMILLRKELGSSSRSALLIWPFKECLPMIPIWCILGLVFILLETMGRKHFNWFRVCLCDFINNIECTYELHVPGLNFI